MCKPSLGCGGVGNQATQSSNLLQITLFKQTVATTQALIVGSWEPLPGRWTAELAGCSAANHHLTTIMEALCQASKELGMCLRCGSCGFHQAMQPGNYSIKKLTSRLPTKLFKQTMRPGSSRTACRSHCHSGCANTALGPTQVRHGHHSHWNESVYLN